MASRLHLRAQVQDIILKALVERDKSLTKAETTTEVRALHGWNAGGK